MKKQRLTPKIGGAVYILPNLLTTGNLFFGFFSIIKSVQNHYTLACVAILLASIFDILDGRVARLTKGTSEFGVQYDSLCDLISFGLAPSILMYQYSLHSIGRVGWIISFVFLVCGALRLARFNVQSYVGEENDDFIGLPIPMAAGVIACFIAFLEDVGENTQEFDFAFWNNLQAIISSDQYKLFFLTIFGPLLAFLMVSNVAYRSHKSIKTKSIKPFNLLAILAVGIGIVAYKPALIGFVFFLVYALSGLFEYFVGWKKARDDEIFKPIEDKKSIMEPQDSSSGDEN